VAIVESRDYGIYICDMIHEKERQKHGRSVTRYRISAIGDDYVCSEDLNEEQSNLIINNMPLSPEDKEK